MFNAALTPPDVQCACAAGNQNAVAEEAVVARRGIEQYEVRRIGLVLEAQTTRDRNRGRVGECSTELKRATYLS